MKNIRIYAAFFLLYVFITISLGAQDAIIEPAVISNASSAQNPQLHWILGESFVSYRQTNDVVLSEGFFQGLGLLTSTEDEHLNLELTIFPNPFTEYINIVTDSEKQLHYRIFNASGQLVYSGEISESQTRYDLTTLELGLYYLTIEDKESNRNTVQLTIVELYVTNQSKTYENT